MRSFLLSVAITAVIVTGVSVATAAKPKPKPGPVVTHITFGPWCINKHNGIMRSVKTKQACLVGEARVKHVVREIPGPQGLPGKNGTNGKDGAVGPQGPTGATGAPGPPGKDGNNGGLGNATATLCISPGGNVKINVPCNPGHDTELKVVIVS